MDDWGDIEPGETRMSRRAASRRNDGLRREQRFMITLGVVAAVTLVMGLGLGFAAGRATAPKPAPAPTPVAAAASTTTPDPASFVTTTAADTTPSVEPTVSDVATASTTPTVTTPPKTPKQLSPADGDRLKTSTVLLRWSKVTAADGGTLTYAFEIQTRVNGKWTNDQVIDGLTKTSYKARVLTARRRWRVWAVVDGKASSKSGWHEYAHTAAVTPKPKSSTNTTGTN
jgi:cytoskeletal protein RodZ